MLCRSIRYEEIFDILSKKDTNSSLIYSFAEKYEDEIKDWFKNETNHTAASFRESVCRKIPGIFNLIFCINSNRF